MELIAIAASLPWGSYLEAAFAVHAAALVIVNLTPTPKDDAVVYKFYRGLEVVAGLLSKRVKM